MSKPKTLAELFAGNATTEENMTTVTKDFYYSQMPVKPEIADKVNEANMKFVKTAAEVSKDGHIEMLKSGKYDGISTTFETGTTGFTFGQHTMVDDVEGGVSTHGTIEHVGDEELDAVYESYGTAYQEAIDVEAEEPEEEA